MKPSARKTVNTVRIIGGKWRGKKLNFADVGGLRPTPDRVRETVFNWLQGPIVEARVLDLFAGSGAFGLEALSRGAAKAVFVDEHRKVVQQLKEHTKNLNCDNAAVVQDDVLHFLRTAPMASFDVVFVDPPYGKGLLQPCLARLEQGGWLAREAYVYLEAESALKNLTLPPGWELHRSKQAGQVGYHLAIRHAA